jgi:hypothetical protein
MAVCIVGWDDNYSASNFNTTPPADGAWIVRNSRGTGWGDNGYFYVSYYDSMLTAYSVMYSVPSDLWVDNIYQHDPLGWTWDWGGWGQTEGWGANVFTAAADETFQMIGFYVNDINWHVDVSIYTGVTGISDPTNGTLAATKSHEWDYPGFQPLGLDSPIYLTAGEKFSVVIHYDTDTEQYPVPIEYPWPSYSSAASADPGESFVSEDGLSWYDLGQAEDANICIKAYTVPAAPEINVRMGGMDFPVGSTKDFGTKPMNAVVGREFTFNIDNEGNAPLTITEDVYLAGSEAHYFMVSEQPTSPVPAFGTTTFKLKTKSDTVPPVPVGFEKQCTFQVNIRSDDEDETNYDFWIKVNLKKTS